MPAALPRLSAGAWWAVAFVGVNSGVGYFLWLWSLNRAGATRVTVFLALSPITAAALGTLLLGEATSSLFGIGVALVAGGLWLAQHPAERRLEARL
jgi:drug/metabolite transporter (DMT)-like permease